jgi:hypothetical protein
MQRLIFVLLPAALLAGETRYARLGDFQGQAEVQLRASDAWMPAERNLPLMESSRVRTGPAARLELELDEGSAWRVGANSQFEVSDYTRLSTGQRITLLWLDRGIAYFTGQSEGNDALMLAVPGAQVAITRGARVRMEVQDQWSQIAVIEGTVRFSSPAAELDLREGQSTRIEASNPARFFLQRQIPALELDVWSEDRDKALSTSASAGHVVQRYGVVDLDAAGEWIQTDDLGAVWKPKASAGWTPYQKGRWRWYDSLGYTWVSDDAWGWLPYHYGRWQRRENIGWVWAPSRNSTFKPGEVYWMRGSRIAGWGALAPGEQWPAVAPENAQPQQYAAAQTVWAAWPSDAALMDPAGFTATPKDPLTAAAFTVALPSPAFPASKLDAARPLLRAGRVRITPVLDGITFGEQSAPVSQPADPAPPPPPVTAPAPPPPTVAYPPPPPVIVPTPNILIVNSPGNPDYSSRPRFGTNKPPAPAAPPAPSTPAATPPATSSTTPPVAPSGRPVGTIPRINLPNGNSDPPKRQIPQLPGSRPANPPSGTDNKAKTTAERREKKFHDDDEGRLFQRVSEGLRNNNAAQALQTLDQWTKRYRESDYAGERAYYYMQAYSATNQPSKVVDAGAPLLAKGLDHTFEDPFQIVGVLYLESLNFQKLPNPTQDQFAMGKYAANELLRQLPVCFVPQNKPAATSTNDWAKARTDLELLARQTIATIETRATAFR